MEVWELPEVIGWGWDEACIQIQTKGRNLRTFALLLIWICTSPDTKEELLLPERKRSSFPTPAPLDKTVAHQILRAELLCLPACIPHKRPISINLFLAYYFVLSQFLLCWGTKNLKLSKYIHQVSDYNLKTAGFKCQSGFWLSSGHLCCQFHKEALPQELGGAQFSHPRGGEDGKRPPLPLSWSSSSSLVSGKRGFDPIRSN